MREIVGYTTLAVFPETVTDLDIIKAKTGLTKKVILKVLVKRELARMRARKEYDLLEAVAVV